MPTGRNKKSFKLNYFLHRGTPQKAPLTALLGRRKLGLKPTRTMDNTGAHILLIEDDPLDAEFAVQLLKKNYLGDNLMHINNGKTALEYLLTISTPPNLIIMDLNLPGIQGIELLRTIRKNERTKEVPVVVLTASWEERDIIETHMLSVSAYMMKPINTIKLKKIASIIGHDANR